MTIEKQKKYRYYIGIDISKLTLDFTLMDEQAVLFHRVIKNDPTEIQSFLKELRSLTSFRMGNAIFGMEQTGIYSNHLKNCLMKAKANFVIENPLHLKNSFGIVRGKTDQTDSKRIAEYLIRSRLSLKLWSPKREVLQQLASLSALRSRLLGMLNILKVPLKEDQGFLSKAITKESRTLSKNTTEGLESDIRSVEARILQLWTSDKELNLKMKHALSVPSIGPQTALQIMITTNEFKDINDPKKFASYAGVAPFQYQSGTSVKRRTGNSPIANKKMKALLHTCALTAVRWSPDLKSYRDRKLKEGKNRMSVLNAIRFKLICRVFACVNQNRLFEKEYTNNPQQNILGTEKAGHQNGTGHWPVPSGEGAKR